MRGDLPGVWSCPGEKLAALQGVHPEGAGQAGGEYTAPGAGRDSGKLSKEGKHQQVPNQCGIQIKLAHDRDGCHNDRSSFTPGWAWAPHLFLHNEAEAFPLYSGVPAPSLSSVLTLHWPHAFIMLHTSVCVQVWADCFCGMKINQVSSKASDVGPSPDASDLLLKAGREHWALLCST